MIELDTLRWVDDLGRRHEQVYRALIGEMLLAVAAGDALALAQARERYEAASTATMGLGEVLGAALVLRGAAGVFVDEGLSMRADRERMVAFREDSVQTIVPAVDLQEAIDEMVRRTPVTLRDAAERAGARIAQLYSERRVVAFAKSAEEAVTERVHGLIVQMLRDGVPEDDAVARIRTGVDEVRTKTEAWTTAYARTAYRTNVATAVTAGRFRQAEDKDIVAVIPCFQFDTAGDGDVRPNHRAANGVILRVSNPTWSRIAPPLGYSCRCIVSLMSTPMLRRLGRVGANGEIYESSVPADAYPDPGFRHGGRPDLFVAGATA